MLYCDKLYKNALVHIRYLSITQTFFQQPKIIHTINKGQQRFTRYLGSYSKFQTLRYIPASKQRQVKDIFTRAPNRTFVKSTKYILLERPKPGRSVTARDSYLNRDRFGSVGSVSRGQPSQVRFNLGVLTARTWCWTFGRRRCAEMCFVTAERTSVCRTRSRTKLTGGVLDPGVCAATGRMSKEEKNRIGNDRLRRGEKTPRTAIVIGARL